MTKCLSSFFSKFKRKPPKPVEPESVVSNLLSSYPANPVQHPELNPELNDMTPNLEKIIAFVNPKSGGQKGRIVFERLKNYLHKDNVFDLTKGGPRPGLEAHKDKEDLKVIACGGDGTVGWVLSVIDEMRLPHPPAVAILPLGTGNDLARTLGWGGGYNNESMEIFLNKVIRGNVVKLDRWSITTTPTDTENSTESTADNNEPKNSDAKKKLPSNVINNYFSIGADAKVALDFHQAREKNPELFTSQAFNKIEYAKNFSSDLINQSCKNTFLNIEEFTCDDEDMLDKINEFKCHSIVFLNIPSYASGKKPWKNDESNFSRQSYSDGKMEIVGFHTADFMLLQMGGHGDSIFQGRKLRIVTKEPMPMQVDGEPVLLAPCTIIIDLKNQASMVAANEDTSVLVACAATSCTC